MIPNCHGWLMGRGINATTLTLTLTQTLTLTLTGPNPSPYPTGMLPYMIKTRPSGTGRMCQMKYDNKNLYSPLIRYIEDWACGKQDTACVLKAIGGAIFAKPGVFESESLYHMLTVPWGLRVRIQKIDLKCS